ncbi:MAG: hypothetical protein ABIJ85_01100 [bacterium]
MKKPKFEVKKELSKETLKYLKENKLMTVKQYSKVFKKSEWVIQRMCKNNDLPCKRLGSMWAIENKKI